MSVSVIRWEDPPPSAGAAHDWRSIAAELRKRPGVWAHVATYGAVNVASSMAYQARTGRMAGTAPAGSVEAQLRTVDGEHRVYARWVRDGDPR